MSANANKAVFLSYASQDAEAARKICEALRAAGVEVWFDSDGGLEHGDEWDAKIRRQIKECVLFIPVISANTQARHEGYFRIEWELAAQRAMGIASGIAFILPVVIDHTREPEALVPDRFRAVQWTKLKDGEIPPEVTQRFVKLWRQRAGSPSANKVSVAERPIQEVGAGATRPAAARRLITTIAGLIALGGIAAWRWGGGDGLRSDRAFVPPANESRPEIKVTLARINALLARTDVRRAELDLASDQLVKAAALDPADAHVFASWALVDCRYLEEFFDSSPARRDLAQRHATQAAGLNPGDPMVRLARAVALRRSTKDPAMLAEARRLFEQVNHELPDHPQPYSQLGWLSARAGDSEKARDWFSRWSKLPGQAAAAAFNLGMLELFAKNYADGFAGVETAIAREKAVTFLLWKAYLQTIWVGDVVAARQTLTDIPAEYFGEDMAASAKFLVQFWSRDFVGALATIRAIPREYLQSGAGAFSSGYYRGLCLDRLGKSVAAESEWRAALTVVQRRLDQEGNEHELLLAKATLLSVLNEKAAAEQVWRTARELYGAQDNWLEEYLAAHQLPLEEAIERLQQRYRRGDLWCTAAVLRLSPMYDHLRTDPRFVALQAEADANPRFSPQAGRSAANGAPVAAADGKSVAVLPFASAEDDKESATLADGIAEELLYVLAKVPGLKVPARTSAFHFKGRNVPVPEIARQLGVAHVVEGSVRRRGGVARITVQLIKAADGFRVWGENFERDAKDALAVQDEIALEIARSLSLTLGEGPRNVVPTNLEAHRLFLEGRHFWSLRTEEGFVRSEAALRRALELDPKFARAHAALADLLVVRGWYHLEGNEAVVPDHVQAEVSAQRALELDPTLAEPHAVLGVIALVSRQAAEAERLFSRTLALAPNYATAHNWLAELRLVTGRLDQALDGFRRAAELDPLAPVMLNDYGKTLLMARQPGEGLAILEREEALNPGAARNGVYRARALLAVGRREEAISAIRPALDRILAGEHSYVAGEAVHTLRSLGQVREAKDFAASMLGRLAVQDATRGFILAALGDFSGALPALERRFAINLEQEFWHEMFDPIRADPNFTRLITRLGCDEEYRVARSTLAAMLSPKRDGK